MTNAFMSVVRSAIVVATLCLPAIAQAQAPSHLIVFGDSLSDTGNDLLATIQLQLPVRIPPPQTYAAGRFSNGPVAFEYLWSFLSGGAPVIPPSFAVPVLPQFGAVSFAFGGSGSGAFRHTLGLNVPGFLTQIVFFGGSLGARPAPPDALYAVWTGSNDYLALTPESPETVVDNIAEGIETLYLLGARDFLVVNLPDLGSGPLLPEDQRPLLTSLTTEHNKLLRKKIKELEKTLPEIRIIEGDVTKVFRTALRTFESAVPLVDVLVPVPPGALPASLCLSFNPAACPVVPSFAPAAAFVFWDSEHPTTAAHERLAEALLTAVTKGLAVHH